MNEKSRHLIFIETHFDRLPESVRKLGPWQRLKSGEFEKLRLEYQHALTVRGYIIIDKSAGSLSVET
jgi:hypothetical protein